MKSNIALIGFMGCGKSSAGKRLALRIGWEFKEIDRLIEQRTGLTIPAIFREKGEEYFRDMEEAVIKELSVEHSVISCGGGVVLRPSNIERLKESSHIVYLEADTATLQDRLAFSKHRPLLERPDRNQVIEEMNAQRRPLYESSAEITVMTGHRPFNEVIEEIIDKLDINESQNR
ncbi:shikimate kinase I [Dehalogenimonas sp. WBC-2]|nr:shikimate kinase I [Dehalogenimonas sp. WBC-2]